MHRYHGSYVILIGALAAVFLASCSSDGSHDNSDPLHVRVAEGELEGVIRPRRTRLLLPSRAPRRRLAFREPGAPRPAIGVGVGARQHRGFRG
jgi:hypothetical protein